MLYSMTGYGRTEFSLGDFICAIEIRSLNGKQFELNTKIPSIIKLYEIELRNILQQHLSRGTIEVSIYLKQHGSSKPLSINTDLAKYYYTAISDLATQFNLPQTDLLGTIMRMPEIVSAGNDVLDESLWQLLQQKVIETANILNQHRQQEGIMLTAHIKNNIAAIQQYCEAVQPFEKKRTERIREKLHQSLNDFLQTNNADKNRLEQEIIYYIEKFDITEEKNRLSHHCNYFIELLSEEGNTKGKKLGFLLQEIGREINTMGSKANDVDIQKLVVDMKDELEQAKEQLLNAL